MLAYQFHVIFQVELVVRISRVALKLSPDKQNKLMVIRVMVPPFKLYSFVPLTYRDVAQYHMIYSIILPPSHIK